MWRLAMRKPYHGKAVRKPYSADVIRYVQSEVAAVQLEGSVVWATRATHIV